MGHVHERHVELTPQPEYLVKDQALSDDVETGGGLVENDQLRIARERERNRHTLLLAAGQLMRKASPECSVRRELDAP